MIAGLVLLAALVLLAVTLFEPQVVTPFPIPEGIDTAQSIALFSLPAIVVIYAALLFNIGVSRVQERAGQSGSGVGDALNERRSAGRTSAGVFILIILLLGVLQCSILFGRMYSAQGNSPLNVDVCQQTIDYLRVKYNWDAVLKEYGKPTPTPDLGE
jgi:hypothetical protein